MSISQQTQHKVFFLYPNFYCNVGYIFLLVIAYILKCSFISILCRYHLCEKILFWGTYINHDIMTQLEIPVILLSNHLIILDVQIIWLIDYYFRVTVFNTGSAYIKYIYGTILNFRWQRWIKKNTFNSTYTHAWYLHC